MKRGMNVALTREIPTLTGVVIGVRLAATEGLQTLQWVISTGAGGAAR